MSQIFGYQDDSIQIQYYIGWLAMLWKKLKTQKSKQQLISNNNSALPRNQQQLAKDQHKPSNMVPTVLDKQAKRQGPMRNSPQKHEMNSVFQSLKQQNFKNSPLQRQQKNQVIKQCKVTETILISPNNRQNHLSEQQNYQQLKTNTRELEKGQKKNHKQPPQSVPQPLTYTLPVKGNKNKIQKEVKNTFDSLSLGNDKPKKKGQVNEYNQSLMGKLDKLQNQENKKVMYSENSFNKNNNQSSLSRHYKHPNDIPPNRDQQQIENKQAKNYNKFQESINNFKNQENDELLMDDFFRQIKQAGIDVSDLPQNQKSKQNVHSIAGQQLFQKLSQISRIPHKSNRSNSQFKLSQTQRNLYNNITEERKESINKQKLRKCLNKILRYMGELKEGIKGLNLIRKTFDSNINQYIRRECEYLKQILERNQNNMKSQLNKKKQIISENTKTIQQLRFRILKYEGEKLEKQTTIIKQIQRISDLQTKNQELNQIVFDLNQKIAQSQLLLRKQLQEIVQKYETRLKLNEKGEKRIADQEKEEIRRLNEQVEELKKLYERSLQQNKKNLQNERLKIAKQMQNLAQTQQILNQKQASVNQKLKKLQQKTELNRLQRQMIKKQQQQLQALQKVLQSRCERIQSLQQQLNSGFMYVQNCKKELAQNVQNLQNQKEQFMKRIAEAQRRAAMNAQLTSNINRKNDLIRKQKSLYWNSMNNNADPQQIRNEEQNKFILKRMRQNQIEKQLFTEEFQRPQKLNNELNTQRIMSTNLFKTENGYNYLNTLTPRRKFETQLNPNDYRSAIRQFKNNIMINYNLSKSRTKYMDKNYNSAQNKLLPQNQRMSARNYQQYREAVREPNHNNIHYVGQNRRHHNIFSESQAKRYKGYILQNLQSQLHKNYKIGLSKVNSKQQSPKLLANKRQPEVNSRKLNELDSKIEVLRNQIKKQIIAAKSH